MMREQVDDLLTVLHPAGVNFFTQDNFRVGVVQLVVKFKRRILTRLFDAPSSEAASDFRDIFLSVTAVNTKGVQLHQFAAVIFVEAAFLFLFLRLRILRWREWAAVAAVVLARGALRGLTRGAGIGTQIIVQIKKHGWALRGGGDEILKFPQRMRLDDV